MLTKSRNIPRKPVFRILALGVRVPIECDLECRSHEESARVDETIRPPRTEYHIRLTYIHVVIEVPVQSRGELDASSATKNDLVPMVIGRELHPRSPRGLFREQFKLGMQDEHQCAINRAEPERVTTQQTRSPHQPQNGLPLALGELVEATLRRPRWDPLDA